MFNYRKPAINNRTIYVHKKHFSTVFRQVKIKIYGIKNTLFWFTPDRLCFSQMRTESVVICCHLSLNHVCPPLMKMETSCSEMYREDVLYNISPTQ